MPTFTSPPNPHAFTALVWDIVRQIPAGKVATYGQIAALIPPPGGMPLPDYLTFGAGMLRHFGREVDLRLCGLARIGGRELKR